MCGFVGFFNNAPDVDANSAVVKAMADRIVHRGPDQGDIYVDDQVSLGFRRLSIIDLEGGSQPIFNEDGSVVLVFNGEIYNYQSLREELIAKGHTFRTHTDSEVLIHGYEEYGKELLPRLRGMFAFVIWDKKTGTLYGARDIFGIKPFFYYNKDGRFLFASEIKAFLAHPDFEKEFNEERLPEYLCFEYLPCNETLFKNVYKLSPGSWFEYRDGKFETGRYFTMRYDIDETKSMAEWQDMIGKTFRDSCAVHSIADVEVGGFLSSGVDSSYAVKEMSMRNSVRTFSVGYAEEKYSELKYAQDFAKTIGVENYAKKITAEEFFDATPRVQYYMDEPLPNPSAVSLYFLTKLASEQVKVVLSGEGADELFGGYYYYQDPLYFERYQKLPQGLRRALAKAAVKLPRFHGRRFLIRGAETVEGNYVRNNYVFSWDERDRLLAKGCHAPNPATFTAPYFARAKDLDEVTKMQYVDMQTWLVQDILVKADRMSMANSLELRVPFLDKEMLKLALSIPTRYRVSKEETKLALRGAALKCVPEKVASMPKTGFLTPLNDWLCRDEFYTRVKDAFNGETARRFFNLDYINRLLDDHKEGRQKNMKRIWSVYCFILWYDIYFTRDGVVA